MAARVDQGPVQPVFHITHWKAGSQWVRAVLKRLVGPRLHGMEGGREGGREGVGNPLRPDGVYSPVYMTVEQFEQAVGREGVGGIPHRRFVVIRDLRDTVVSWYFSLLLSHPTGGMVGGVGGTDRVLDFRRELAGMGKDEGMQYLIRGRLLGMMRIQRQWLLKAAESGGAGGGSGGAL